MISFIKTKDPKMSKTPFVTRPRLSAISAKSTPRVIARVQVCIKKKIQKFLN